MYTVKVKGRRGRTFTAIYRCEHCGHQQEAPGCDSQHFNESLVPEMACGSCEKNSLDSFEPLTPRHP